MPDAAVPPPSSPRSSSNKPSPSSLHEPRDEAPTALLVIDMVGTWDFPGGKPLLKAAFAAAPVIARLKARCRAAGVPVIYANDNQGRWRCDWRQLMDDARAAGGNGARITELLAPDREDYFVLKPMHSAFFATPLQLLLQSLGTRRLILTGASSDQCVLATASAAHMHQYEIVIPRDAVAAPSAARARAALRHFEDVLQLPTTPAARLRLPPRGVRAGDGPLPAEQH